jgi:VIT1/CCC1 family predicted Fe2+/Mn2+ transporter
MVITFLLGILSLFLLGIYVAKISGRNKLKMGLMYALVGIIGTILAYAIGTLLNQVIH